METEDRAHPTSTEANNPDKPTSIALTLTADGDTMLTHRRKSAHSVEDAHTEINPIESITAMSQLDKTSPSPTRRIAEKASK